MSPDTARCWPSCRDGGPAGRMRCSMRNARAVGVKATRDDSSARSCRCAGAGDATTPAHLEGDWQQRWMVAQILLENFEAGAFKITVPCSPAGAIWTPGSHRLFEQRNARSSTGACRTATASCRRRRATAGGRDRGVVVDCARSPEPANEFERRRRRLQHHVAMFATRGRGPRYRRATDAAPPAQHFLVQGV